MLLCCFSAQHYFGAWALPLPLPSTHQGPPLTTSSPCLQSVWWRARRIDITVDSDGMTHTPPASSSPSSSASQLDLYGVLGVAQTATATDIGRAYRNQALLLHPDKQSGEIDQQPGSFQQLVRAYNVLSDADQRQQYDQQRQSQSRHSRQVRQRQCLVDGRSLAATLAVCHVWQSVS